MTDGERLGGRPHVAAAVASPPRLRGRPAARLVAGAAAAATLLRRHLALVAVLTAGAVLRVAATVAVWPGIWFSDGNDYISVAARGVLSRNRASGYSLVVAPFFHAHSAAALIVFQHVLGLAIAVLLYWLLLRRGAPRRVAVLGVAPAALDPYLVFVEHTIMAETVFHAALAGALACVLAGERLGRGAVLAAGLLLGYAAVVRTVAVPLVAVVALYLLARRARWDRLVTLGAGWALVVGAYAAIFAVQHGHFGLTESNGRFLYGRVAPFADCARLGPLPADERRLCPRPGQPRTTNFYLRSGDSPIHGRALRDDRLLRDFSLRVIYRQPLDYAGVITGGVLHYFEPGHRIGLNDAAVEAWRFPLDPRVWAVPGYRGPVRAGVRALRRSHPISEPNRFVGRMAEPAHLNVTASRWLHILQRRLFTTGPLLALCVALVALALLLRRGGWRLRLDAALVCAVVLTLLAVSQAVSMFSYRYGFNAIVLLPVAGALAATALLERRTTAATAPPDDRPTDDSERHPSRPTADSTPL